MREGQRSACPDVAGAGGGVGVKCLGEGGTVVADVLTSDEIHGIERAVGAVELDTKVGVWSGLAPGGVEECADTLHTGANDRNVGHDRVGAAEENGVVAGGRPKKEGHAEIGGVAEGILGGLAATGAAIDVVERGEIDLHELSEGGACVSQNE
jgi:hypothetical protein